MKQAIISVCRELVEEANAIIKYTEDIGAVEEKSPATADVLKDIRLDELEHAQKLTLELTRLLSDEGTADDGEGAGESEGSD